MTGDVEVEGVRAVAVDGHPLQARAQRLRLLDERRRQLRLHLADEDLDARVGRRLAEVEAVDVLEVHQEHQVAHLSLSPMAGRVGRACCRRMLLIMPEWAYP